jgi:trk system potassium uptake protein TrkA
VRIIVIGGGYVGRTALQSLHEAHECTLVDVDGRRLDAIADTMDVRTVRGSGARRETLQEAGVAKADLVLACTSRDEANIVSAMLTRRLSRARTVVRVTDMDYLAAWRAGDLDVDAIVSSELETANAVMRVLGAPGARHADFFVGGRVQILEFDVPRTAPPVFCGRRLADAGLPAESRVVAILRAGRLVPVTGDTAIEPGDRLIVVASQQAARHWSLLFTEREPVTDVVVFGAGRAGMAIARVLLARDVRVRLVEADAGRARMAAAQLPRAQVFHATGLDRDFLRRERIGRARAAVFALDDDPRSLYGAVLARTMGVPFTMVVAQRPDAGDVFDAAGVDATIDPADETAEVMVRFALDPRIRQVAMLEDDRFEVLDIAVRADSPLAGRPLADLPRTSSMIGAIVRDGTILFPHGEEQLRPGDRAIVLAETPRVGKVERSF